MRKLMMGVPAWLLIASAVSALVFFGSVIANVMIVNTLDFSQLKIGEAKTLLWAITNETVSPYSLNISTVCLGREAISAKIEFFSDGIQKSKQLDLNGTVPIDLKIDAGNITLSVTGQHQGAFNCTLEPIVSNYTILNFVDVI